MEMEMEIEMETLKDQREEVLRSWAAGSAY